MHRLLLYPWIVLNAVLVGRGLWATAQDIYGENEAFSLVFTYFWILIWGIVAIWALSRRMTVVMPDFLSMGIEIMQGSRPSPRRRIFRFLTGTVIVGLLTKGVWNTKAVPLGFPKTSWTSSMIFVALAYLVYFFRPQRHAVPKRRLL